jgi:hypothetical protein
MLNQLQEGIDFWDFDCRFGENEESSTVIHVAETDKYINKAEADKLEFFYLEILAKPGIRTKRPATKTDAN